jgi:hypothetical protein
MAIAAPREAIAQTSKIYRLGTLTVGPPIAPTAGTGAVLVAGLAQRGYTLGQNLAYGARGAAGKVGLTPQLMQELKTATVDAVVTVSYPAAVAAKASGVATVIASGSGDPVGREPRAAGRQRNGNIRRRRAALHQTPWAAEGNVAAASSGGHAVE